jgi:hypothetical protein
MTPESKKENFNSIPEIMVVTKQKKLSNLEKIIRGRNILRENVKNKITFSKPIITINEQPLFYPRTINVIQGKSGTHKSRLAEHLCSILLKKPGLNIDLLGLEINGLNTSVCYVDSERNLSEQYPYSLQQILLNAGHSISDEISNFDFITLIDIERAERFNSFREYLQKIREDHTGHIFVILDVLTDLVDNFNDPKPSLQLIDLLNSTINTYDITFLCIIHENPFQEKARGHLGTELLNKSSTALSINYEKDSKGNDQDIIKIQFLKCRSSKRIDPVYVKFSQEKHQLIYADAVDIEKAIYSKDIKANVFDISKFIVANIKGSIVKKEFITILRQEYKCTSRTIEDRIKDMLAGAGLSTLGYKLKSTKKGKQVYYDIVKIAPVTQENIF